MSESTEKDDSSTQEEALNSLSSALGYSFEDEVLLITALTHRSFVHQGKEYGEENGQDEDNQRLEFLGDSVLGLAVSTLLYNKFPECKEGVLSRMRAGLVNENRLARIAREIGIPEALLVGRGEEASGGRGKNSILADALEAVVAAIYLDGGFPAARNVVARLWGELIDRSVKDDLLKDFKTRLQEQTQKTWGQTPEYQLTGSQGPDHARTFQVALLLGGQTISTGSGRSKKEAEQSAARNALKTLKEKNFSPSD